jgi:hypothetical protein
MTPEIALVGEAVSIGLLFGIFWKMGRFTAWMDLAEARLKRLEGQ